MKVWKQILVIILVLIGIIIFGNVEQYFCPYKDIDFGVKCAHWGVIYFLRHYVVESGFIFITFFLPLFAAIIKIFSGKFQKFNIFKKMLKIYLTSFLFILLPTITFYISWYFGAEWTRQMGVMWGIIGISMFISFAVGIIMILDFVSEMKNILKNHKNNN